jgi:TRAP-type mannitol/chloroaromatic compound transport system permease large subunit
VRHVTLLLAAIAVVAGALVVSQRTNTEAGREHFVQAWILPQPTGNNLSTRTQLGVRNEEGRSQVLVIVIRVGSAKDTTSTVGLANGQQWTHEVLRATGQPVSATVALASDPTSVLDRVDLAKPS